MNSEEYQQLLQLQIIYVALWSELQIIYVALWSEQTFALNDVKFEVELLDLKNCFVVHQIFSCAWHLETTKKRTFVLLLYAFVLSGDIFNVPLLKLKVSTISFHACSRPDACKVGAEYLW